ncbi:CCA tRNA nucleotidyltransferase [Legionella brunensis]|uniref:Poly(A) polymerase I n=1 Tax=Legionella brunensis TaxID=29422 RepID=A0A0W0SUE6_9GAMM|nr:CCA tRNA nucleotidyltransferase [Legionella brunensis]KTC87000.1 poly(A) polymerase I [Legionella brunensis]
MPKRKTAKTSSNTAKKSYFVDAEAANNFLLSNGVNIEDVDLNLLNDMAHELKIHSLKQSVDAYLALNKQAKKVKIESIVAEINQCYEGLQKFLLEVLDEKDSITRSHRGYILYAFITELNNTYQKFYGSDVDVIAILTKDPGSSLLFPTFQQAKMIFLGILGTRLYLLNFLDLVMEDGLPNPVFGEDFNGLLAELNLKDKTRFSVHQAALIDGTLSGFLSIPKKFIAPDDIDYFNDKLYKYIGYAAGNKRIYPKLYLVYSLLSFGNVDSLDKIKKHDYSSLLKLFIFRDYPEKFPPDTDWEKLVISAITDLYGFYDSNFLFTRIVSAQALEICFNLLAKRTPTSHLVSSLNQCLERFSQLFTAEDIDKYKAVLATAAQALEANKPVKEELDENQLDNKNEAPKHKKATKTKIDKPKPQKVEKQEVKPKKADQKKVVAHEEPKSLSEQSIEIYGFDIENWSSLLNKEKTFVHAYKKYNLALTIAKNNKNPLHQITICLALIEMIEHHGKISDYQHKLIDLTTLAWLLSQEHNSDEAIVRFTGFLKDYVQIYAPRLLRADLPPDTSSQLKSHKGKKESDTQVAVQADKKSEANQEDAQNPDGKKKKKKTHDRRSMQAPAQNNPYPSLVTQQISVTLPKTASVIYDLLQKNGAKISIFGGFVRDNLLGISYDDIDFKVAWDPAYLIKFFSENNYFSELANKDNYPFVRVYIEDTYFDISTYRKKIADDKAFRHYDKNGLLLRDMAYCDPRDEQIALMCHDATTLDLTQNSFYLSREDKGDSQKWRVIAPFGIQFKAAEFVGDLHANIHADPVRILRCIKFYAKGLASNKPIALPCDFKEFSHLLKNPDVKGKAIFYLGKIITSGLLFYALPTLLSSNVLSDLFPQQRACFNDEHVHANLRAIALHTAELKQQKVAFYGTPWHVCVLWHKLSSEQGKKAYKQLGFDFYLQQVIEEYASLPKPLKLSIKNALTFVAALQDSNILHDLNDPFVKALVKQYKAANQRNSTYVNEPIDIVQAIKFWHYHDLLGQYKKKINPTESELEVLIYLERQVGHRMNSNTTQVSANPSSWWNEKNAKKENSQFTAVPHTPSEDDSLLKTESSY